MSRDVILTSGRKSGHLGDASLGRAQRTCASTKSTKVVDDGELTPLRKTKSIKAKKGEVTMERLEQRRSARGKHGRILVCGYVQILIVTGAAQVERRSRPLSLFWKLLIDVCLRNV